MSRSRKWLRRLRRLALVVALVALGGLLAGNLLLNLPAVKSRLSNTLARPDRPVEIGSIAYWPWSGLHLHDVRIGDPEAPLIETDVRARIRPLRLALQYLGRKPLIVDEVECREPRILLALREPGEAPPIASSGQRPPGSPGPGSGERDPGAADPQRPGPATPGEPNGDPADGDSASPSGGKGKVPREVRLGRVLLAGGELSIRDGDEGRELIRIASFEVDYHPAKEAGSAAHGDVRTGEVHLLGRKLSDGGVADLVVKPSRIEIGNIRIPVPGGGIKGSAQVDPGRGLPFQAELEGRDIAIRELLTADAMRRVSAGKVHGKLRLQGHVKFPDMTRGRMVLAAEGLRLRAEEEVGVTGGLVALDAGGDVAFSEANAVFDLSGGRIHLTTASLRSGLMWVKAAGRIERDGSVAVLARLYAGAGSHEGLERTMRADSALAGTRSSLFKVLEGTDWHYRDVPVAGPASSPLVDFWGRGEFVGIEELLRRLAPAPDAATAVHLPTG